MAFTTFASAPCTAPENFDTFQSVIQHTGASKVAECKSICAPCPVKAECLSLGTYDGDILPGVYGGLSQAEREAL
jgi:Transcription factor WhiB